MYTNHHRELGGREGVLLHGTGDKRGGTCQNNLIDEHRGITGEFKLD